MAFFSNALGFFIRGMSIFSRVFSWDWSLIFSAELLTKVISIVHKNISISGTLGSLRFMMRSSIWSPVIQGIKNNLLWPFDNIFKNLNIFDEETVRKCFIQNGSVTNNDFAEVVEITFFHSVTIKIISVLFNKFSDFVVLFNGTDKYEQMKSWAIFNDCQTKLFYNILNYSLLQGWRSVAFLLADKDWFRFSKSSVGELLFCIILKLFANKEIRSKLFKSAAWLQVWRDLI